MSADTNTLRLSAEAEARIEDLQRRYPTKQATLLPVLWEIQWEHGWIPPEWLAYAAERCEVSKAHVLGVVGFYTMFLTEKPGRFHVRVCRNISCHIMGGAKIRECLRKRLGIKPGEKTPDERFYLEEVECMAACSWAPMMAVNETYHENLTPEKVEEIIKRLEQTP